MLSATLLAAALTANAFTAPALAQGDPLPSWNDGAAKTAIMNFVRRTTTPGSPDFIHPADRIATFDNDGTLWAEKPLPTELFFIMARLRQMAAKDSTLRAEQPFKAALDHDAAYFRTAGAQAVLEVWLAAESNMAQEDFAREARAFIDTAHHPTRNVAFTKLVYQPMLELLHYLSANGYETFICSGGTTDFMRAFAPETYGIPTERIIGSTLERESRVMDGRRIVWRLPKLQPPNDKEMKPVGIDGHIGKRPAVAAGNVLSGGDIAMLEYSKGRVGPSLQLMVHHDDAVREYAYDEPDSASLHASKRNGFIVVSMKRDWRTIFP